MIPILVCRLFAFFIDAIFLFFPLLILFFLIFTHTIFWDKSSEILLWCIICAWFAIWEGCYGGQTPGKILMRIRLVTNHNRNPGLYEASIRVFLIIFMPIFLLLIVNGFSSFSHIKMNSILIQSTLLLSSILIWPVSILFGKGSIGLHDIIAGTKVVRVGEVCTQSKIIKQKQKYLLLFSSFFVAILVTIICLQIQKISVFLKGIEEELLIDMHYSEIFKQSEPRDPELFSKITNSNLYIANRRDTLLINLYPWSEDFRGKFTFKNSVYENLFPSEFVEGNLAFLGLYKCTIQTTIKGMFSSDFQREAAQAFLNEHGDQKFLYQFEFVHEERMKPIVIKMGKILIGYPLYSSIEKFQLIEPDNSFVATFGIIFLHR